MKIILIKIVFSTLTCILFFIVPQPSRGAITLKRLDLSVDSGIRNDQFNWSIAGTLVGTDPNILSELTWKDLETFQTNLNGALEIKFNENPAVHPYIAIQLDVGRIYSGENQDSDYDGDNRTVEFSRTNNAADAGYVHDFSLALGQKFSLFQDRLELIPLVGYSDHRQNLKLLNGNQTIPNDGPFSGLNSSYSAKWSGGWLGIATHLKLNHHLAINALSEYHQVEYNAKANWNLQPQFTHPVSFAHSADGRGWIHEIGLDYDLCNQWTLTLSGTFQRWRTDVGLDRVFDINGFFQDTRLNHVNWTSTSLQLGLSYSFYFDLNHL